MVVGHGCQRRHTRFLLHTLDGFRITASMSGRERRVKTVDLVQVDHNLASASSGAATLIGLLSIAQRVHAINHRREAASGD